MISYYGDVESVESVKARNNRCCPRHESTKCLFIRHGLVWSSGGSNLLGIEASINYPGKQPSQDHIDGVEEMHDIGIEMQDRAKRGYVGGKETVKFTQKQTNVVHRVFLSV